MRFVFLAGLVVFISFFLFNLTKETPGSYYAAGVYLAIIVFIQLKRPDKRFLKINIRDFRMILTLEYLLLLLPLFFCLAWHKQWLPMVSAALLAYPVSFIDFRQARSSLNTAIQRLIPDDSFEWKGGVRKSLVFLLVLWIIGTGTSFFIGSVPIILFILGIIPWGFYEKCEPVQMLLACEKGTNGFLWLKLKRLLVLFSIMAVPLVAAFIIFHPDKWYIVVAEFIIIISTQIYILLAKYAFYEPGNKSSSAQAFELIAVISLILPFFIPVIWILSIRFYYKSKENLNFYLDDYN
jgi:hypothetical protein